MVIPIWISNLVGMKLKSKATCVFQPEQSIDSSYTFKWNKLNNVAIIDRLNHARHFISPFISVWHIAYLMYLFILYITSFLNRRSMIFSYVKLETKFR